jgi:hypothetical protein
LWTVVPQKGFALTQVFISPSIKFKNVFIGVVKTRPSIVVGYARCAGWPVDWNNVLSLGIQANLQCGSANLGNG